MELKRVKAEDVFPSEANPRRDFGDLDAMAESFALNPTHPGEPMTPPLLVRDGQVYRIVDGERRYRAMRAAGTAEFDAVVCDDWEDADAALAMLATDDKKQLTDLERSRGVQRALLLGVEPERIERAVRRKGMRRVSRGVRIAGAEAECMTLDHLAAVAEFEGDEERAQRIADADERSWQRVAKECREEAENERAMAKLRSKAAELGIELLESVEGMSYMATCRTPDDLEAARADAPEGAAYVAIADRWNGARVVVYAPDEAEDPEASAARELAEAYSNAAEKALDSIRGYLVGALMEGLCPPSSMKRAAELFLGDEGESWSRRGKAMRAVESSGWDGPIALGKPTGLVGASLALDWMTHAGVGSSAMEYVTGARSGSAGWAVNSVQEFVDVAVLAGMDGWETPSACAELVDELRAWLEEVQAETEEEE